MRQQAMVRAYNDVVVNIEDPTYTLASVAFAAGFLAGGEVYYGFATVIAIAEQLYGGTPDMADLKRKVGLMGPPIELEGTPQPT